MAATPGKTRIGWVGTGVMGASMAMHLIKAGYLPMVVYNRTTWKADSLVQAGATLADSPRQVAQACDVVFTMVGYPNDVREVISGNDGVLAGLSEGSVVVDLTTSEPGLAAELAALAYSQGKYVIDAPVTGGDTGAKKGTLSVLVGGDPTAIKFVMPLLDCFAKKVTVFGSAGSGQHCKLANQITIASTMVGLCEGLLYAHNAGLDLEKYLSAIGSGAAGSFSLNAFAPRILVSDMKPGFFVEHFVKDLSIALNSCRQLNLSLPGLALAQQLYVSLMAHNEGKLGTQALIRALERLNDKKLPVKESFSAW